MKRILITVLFFIVASHQVWLHPFARPLYGPVEKPIIGPMYIGE